MSGIDSTFIRLPPTPLYSKKRKESCGFVFYTLPVVVAQQTITPLALFHATTMCGVTVIALLKTQGGRCLVGTVWFYVCVSSTKITSELFASPTLSHTDTPSFRQHTHTHTHTHTLL